MENSQDYFQGLSRPLPKTILPGGGPNHWCVHSSAQEATKRWLFEGVDRAWLSGLGVSTLVQRAPLVQERSWHRKQRGWKC